MSEEERSQDALTAKIGQVRHLVLQQWKRMEVGPGAEGDVISGCVELCVELCVDRAVV